jgi:drug/metabolite transporter (DMT)-like permease
MVAEAPLSPGTRGSRLTGIILVLSATMAWSLTGFFTRLLTTDVSTAVAWRSFFGGLFLFVPFVATKRGQTWSRLFAIGRAGVLLATCQMICQACTVGALYYTSVANVAVIYATAPFMAAGLARWLFGEKLAPRTLLAAFLSAIGVVIVVAGSVGTGHGLGDILALGMTISFAFVIVIPRARRDLPMLPTTIWSAFATFACFAPFSSPLELSAQDWSTLALFGLTNFTIALFLFLHGARRIPSAEAALIGTSEIVLTPLWVWLAFAERPSIAALAGGAVILFAVVGHTLLDLYQERR